MCIYIYIYIYIYTIKQLAGACHITATTIGERNVTCASYIYDKSPKIA
jgi:hypothetical protein